jgi:hypothetical protein
LIGITPAEKTFDEFIPQGLAKTNKSFSFSNLFALSVEISGCDFVVEFALPSEPLVYRIRTNKYSRCLSLPFVSMGLPLI